MIPTWFLTPGFYPILITWTTCARLDGRSQKVRDFVLNSEETRAFLTRLYDFVDYLLPGFLKEGKSSLTISVGCTGGRHRSVVIAEALKAHLKARKQAVKIIHRDIYK